MSEPKDQTSHDKVKKNLEDLYQIFIQPIFDLLASMKLADKLVFALDEVLTNMPFPILRNSTTGEYLFENHTISFTPVLQVLVHCDQRDISLQESSLKVVPSMALGDPEYPLSGDKLLGTLNEINDICDLFSEVEVGYVETLHGVEATAKNLLSRAELPVDEVRGFIHLAAYNHVNKDHKSGSLHLAYPKLVKRDRASKRMAAEKAYLWSEKIMQCGFEWRSHMVVLSACDSAKGYVLGSEGVVGLSRAFLVARVPCIITSQWKVGDTSSSELMLEFYKEMRGGCDASAVLQIAMSRKMKVGERHGSVELVDICKYGGFLVWGSPTVTLPPSMLIKEKSSNVNQASAST